MLKVRTLFSGIGAPESALKKLGVDFEIVDFCEIDKYAVKSYCAIHGVDESKNLGDISKVWGRDLPYADLLVWGFPCQDISVAGKQRGIQEGETRSGLYYEGFRILKETRPKYSIIENVKNLVRKSFRADFDSMLDDIEGIGYNNYWKVLNAKNYGIPQNRERVFIVSIRKDVDTGGFGFPEGFDNGLRLKDFLEDEVDEKFYISQEKTEKLISQIKQNNPVIKREKGEADGVYTNQSLNFTRPPLKDLSRTLKANVHDAAVVMPIDKSYNNPKPIEIANCITAREDRGISNHQAEGTAVCIPCLTPDREEKRQNGRRLKEDGDPMFTLTGQDRHGILIDDQGRTKKKLTLKSECPTLRAQSHGNEPKVLQIGNIVDTGNWNNPQRGRIYSAEGCSPTLNTVGGGGIEPKILRPERTEYGKAIRKQYEAGEVEESRHNMTELQPRKDGICNTLTTVQKDNLVLEPKVAVKEATKQGYAIAEEGDSINIQFPNSNTGRGRVGKECAQTLETSCNQATLTQDYRIRKLTPRECWRLTGFLDEEFQKAQDAGVSNSQLYKQAGNSIVTTVLVAFLRILLK